MTDVQTDDNDYTLQLARRRVKRRMMRAILRTKPKIKPCLGFRFTPEDEARIRMAIESAKEFMKTYGKPTEIPEEAMRIISK